MNSKENIRLMVAADNIRTNDREADRIGRLLAGCMRLKKDSEYKDRWQTAWGTKTNIGLARTIIAQLEEIGKDFLGVNG